MDVAIRHNIPIEQIFEGKQPSENTNKDSHRLKPHKKKIEQIASDILKIAIIEVGDKSAYGTLVTVKNRIRRNFVEAAILKAIESIETLNPSTDEYDDLEEREQKVNAILGK